MRSLAWVEDGQPTQEITKTCGENTSERSADIFLKVEEQRKSDKAGSLDLPVRIP